MKLLLVDDDPDILDVVSVALRFQWRDITVLTAQTGASHAARAGQNIA